RRRLQPLLPQGHGAHEAAQRPRTAAPAGPDRLRIAAGVRRQASESMTAIVSPTETGVPSITGSSLIVPDLWAVISFSIFIASMMQMSWPSSTVWPCSTSTFHMLPCSGESSSSAPAWVDPYPDLRAPRLGAARPAAGPAPFGAAPPAN